MIANKIHTNYVPLVRLYAVKERFLPYGVEEHLNTPEKVVKMVGRLLKDADREYAIVVSVDSKSKPVGVEIVAVGGLNVAYVEPREIFKHAILCNAAGIIFVHNHPSGEQKPSRTDLQMTKKMSEAGEVLGVRILDHIIVGADDEFYSFKQNNRLDN